MNTGLTHTVCLTCRRARGWRAYDKAPYHAVLTRDGRLRCRWCRALLALVDDYDKEDVA
jgi:hypothetical protein